VSITRNPQLKELEDAVGGFLSDITVRTVLTLAANKVGCDVSEVKQEHLPAMVRHLRQSARLFLRGEQLQPFASMLDELAATSARARASERLRSTLAARRPRGERPPRNTPPSPHSSLQRGASQLSVAHVSEAKLLSLGPPTERLRVETPQAMNHAISSIGRLADALQPGSFGKTRVVTAASELIRNAVNYTGDAWVRAWLLMPERKVAFVVEDHGRGIAHLEQVLSGAYESQTGLGRGLAGTQELADTFMITTSTTGTRVYVEFAFARR